MTGECGRNAGPGNQQAVVLTHAWWLAAGGGLGSSLLAHDRTAPAFLVIVCKPLDVKDPARPPTEPTWMMKPQLALMSSHSQGLADSGRHSMGGI